MRKKVPFTLGVVGHFGLAVRSPKRSAKWFERALGLKKQFEFDGGIAIGNDNVTIALHKGKPSPRTLGHMSFHLPSIAALKKALAHLRKHKSNLKIPATRSDPKRRARRTWACGFMIPTDIVGS